jgi:phosphoribosylaminoimidazole carboxylase (NCAIR synthetase)
LGVTWSSSNGITQPCDSVWRPIISIGDWDNSADFTKLGALADVVTLENEFVDVESLAQLEQSGHKLWPAAATMRVVQDKLRRSNAGGGGLAGAPVL